MWFRYGFENGENLSTLFTKYNYSSKQNISSIFDIVISC